ncbi:MAG: hypothetical protein RIB47_07645 [Cyclobacteriaceae bacterium]
MEIRDLIVTPIVTILIYMGAYFIRPFVTDSVNRKYFLPGLTVRVLGAIAIGFIYQFYYGGGDTFNFHTYGSRIIWEAFMDSPSSGAMLLFSDGTSSLGIYEYASRITFYNDPASFFVVKIAAIFDLITFSSYSATALLFSVLSFVGGWMLFLAFYKESPGMHKWQAIAALFIPSVIFWGSGVMKDTLTLMALGFLTYVIRYLLIEKKFSLSSILLFVLSMWILYSVKKYILLCYMPAALLWVYAKRLSQIKSIAFKILVTPFAGFILIASAYYAVVLVGEDDPRYSIDRLAQTAKITAYDIGFYTGRDAGSGYSLGELDGTFDGMLTKVPQAVNVALYRPYMWEVSNPLMLLSALESFALILLSIYVVVHQRQSLIRSFTDPTIIFCLVFSLTFAFAVGVSTFNFGTLARYKIPLLPFFVLALANILNYSNNDRNLAVLETTE